MPSYESATEISALFKRMGVPLKIQDDPALGKFVVATTDIFPDVVEEGKPYAGKVLATAALFEESGIASWATSELLSTLESNFGLLSATKTKSPDALIGFCNESLALRFVEGNNDGKNSNFVSLVPANIFGQDEATTGIVSAPSTSTLEKVTPFLYSSQEAQQRDTIAALVLGGRGALRQLRAFHTNLEKKAAFLEHTMIPISVESIARCITSAVVRFLKALERSLRAQFKGVHPQSSFEKRIALLKELLSNTTAPVPIPVEGSATTSTPPASDSNTAAVASPANTPNPFVVNLFEASVRPFNRLVEPPEGSEFEASVKTKEWCRVIRTSIEQNIVDVMNTFTIALINELCTSTGKAAENNAAGGIQLNSTTTVELEELSSKGNDAEMMTLITNVPRSAIKRLSVVTSTTGLQPQIASLVAWVPSVVQGWLSDATIITLLGQTTVNAQALTAVSPANASQTADGSTTATAAIEVVQMERDDDDDVDENGNIRRTLVTKKNVCQRVPIFGAAVFTLQSCFNHSCAPNAEVVPTLPYGTGGHDIVVQTIPKDKRISSKGALGTGDAEDDGEGADDTNAEDKKKSEKKDKKEGKEKDKKIKLKPTIKEGDEVNITYIPMLYLALEDYISRRARLESYFFVCECKRCFRENAKAEKAEAKKRTKEAKNGE